MFETNPMSPVKITSSAITTIMAALVRIMTPGYVHPRLAGVTSVASMLVIAMTQRYRVFGLVSRGLI
jgi:hypothetical protein